MKQKLQNTNNIFNQLNKEQLAAVKSLDGPLLVLAGAGTGKTKVLTTRIANLILNGVFPSQIMAVTFTNKAAHEMKERITKTIDTQIDGLFIGTFHSIGARILRRNAELVGLERNFTIITPDDQIRLLKQILQSHNIDEKKWPAKTLAALINKWKDLALSPSQTTNETLEFADGCASQLYRAYQDKLINLNAADFGDLLLHNINLFLENNDILKNYQHRLRYLLVDEYQDTNVSQYLWLRLLAQGHHNLCCVGDDDQSIYGWRGAEIKNILRFQDDYKESKIIRLEHNYRSTKQILAAASHLIDHNEKRLGKTLWTDDKEGEKIKLVAVWDDIDEARFIADEIESLQSLRGVPANEIAVLVRAGFQTRVFEENFTHRAISYKITGAMRFYERMEIRDIISYLRLTSQNNDDLAFERIINLPKRGIGPSTLNNIRKTADDYNISLLSATRKMLVEGSFSQKIHKALATFTDNLDSWKTLSDKTPVSELAEIILKDSGYMEMWKNDKTLESQGRVENLKELLTALQSFESLVDFLEHVSLVMDNEQQDDNAMVNIMTLHSAKGLEFEAVFLPGWERDLFPNSKSLEENGQNGLEEERRLAYVGITRAKDLLYISYAKNRRVYGRYQQSEPSCFLGELPKSQVEFVNQSGAFTSQNSSYEETNEVQTLIGERIFHQKFGYGRIVGQDGNTLSIDFEKAGSKKILSEYVERV